MGGGLATSIPLATAVAFQVIHERACESLGVAGLSGILLAVSTPFGNVALLATAVHEPMLAGTEAGADKIAPDGQKRRTAAPVL